MPFSREAAAKAVRFVERLKHTKGQWDGCPFMLLPWQRELVEELFGRLRADGIRQYRTCYVEIPKKQGKSALAAAIALKMLFADGEPGAEVYGAAVDRSQASIVFNVAAAMVRKSKVLRKRCKIIDSQKRIVVPKTGSFYQVLSAEIRNKHGINPSAVIFDEIHAQKTRHLWDILTVGASDARRQPLVFAITTAGQKKEGIAWDLHSKAEQILKGVVQDPAFLPVIYGAAEGDDWEAEATWRKANPSIGHTVDIERVRDAYRSAKGNPVEEALFRQLRLNQWGVSATTSWLPLDLWDENAGLVVEDKLKDRVCFGGLDLSSVSDLTAWLMVFPRDDDPEMIDVLCRFWVPEARLTDDKNPYRASYLAWTKAGYLKTTPGDSIDYGFVKAQILQDAKTFGLKDFNTDRLFNAYQIMTELAQEGLTPVPFGMGFMSMAGPMKELERRLRARKIRHGGNPVLRWMWDNLDVERDAAGNLKPSKRNKNKKVDGIVALVMALDRAMRHTKRLSQDNEPVKVGGTVVW